MVTTFQAEAEKDSANGTGGAGHAEESSNMHFVPYVEGEPATAESAVPVKKSLLIPIAAAVVLGLAASSLTAVFLTKKDAKSAPTFQDLGAGISNATGLKGSLQVRWQDKAQYTLKIEPIDPLQPAGFSTIMSDPLSPISINIRILDATGFALCGKEILVHFDSANEKGKDVFQNVVGEDGKVTAANAQGILPCSPDQFRQASYWDFNTDFPTLAEQDALLKGNAAQRARLEAAKRAALRREYARSSASFTAEGDDRASGYDSSRNVLEARLGRNFLVTRASDRSIASAWGSNGTLFHSKCDQHSRCTLTHAGGGESIYVFALQ